MSIEQQIRDAVTDFHDLIAEDLDIPTALDEASSANGLKDGVLEHHLSKRLPLAEIVDEIRREADRRRTYETIYDAVHTRVCDSQKNWFKPPDQKLREMLSCVETALGHPLSSEEEAQALAAERKVREELSMLFHREVLRTLRKIEPKCDAED